MTTQIFTYDEAQALVPEVRRVTEGYYRRMLDLQSQLEQLQHIRPGTPHRQGSKINEWINEVIAQWTEDITALGALPNGLWTVDFDSGRGIYFCWTYDEEQLSYCHRYDEGFIGRRPMTDEDKYTPMRLN